MENLSLFRKFRKIHFHKTLIINPVTIGIIVDLIVFEIENTFMKTSTLSTTSSKHFFSKKSFHRFFTGGYGRRQFFKCAGHDHSRHEHGAEWYGIPGVK